MKFSDFTWESYEYYMDQGKRVFRWENHVDGKTQRCYLKLWASWQILRSGPTPYLPLPSSTAPPTVHISTILPPIPKITCMNTNFLLLFSLVIIQIPIQILVHTYLYNTLFLSGSIRGFVLSVTSSNTVNTGQLRSISQLRSIKVN